MRNIIAALTVFLSVVVALPALASDADGNVTSSPAAAAAAGAGGR